MKTKYITVVVFAVITPFLAFGGRMVVKQPEEQLPAPTYAEVPQSEDAEIGMVVMALLSVSEKGVVEKVEIQRADAPLFAESVKGAVEQWRFKPAVRDGEAVKSRVLVPFRVVEPPAFSMH